MIILGGLGAGALIFAIHSLYLNKAKNELEAKVIFMNCAGIANADVEPSIVSLNLKVSCTENRIPRT